MTGSVTIVQKAIIGGVIVIGWAAIIGYFLRPSVLQPAPPQMTTAPEPTAPVQNCPTWAVSPTGTLVDVGVNAYERLDRVHGWLIRACSEQEALAKALVQLKKLEQQEVSGVYGPMRINRIVTPVLRAHLANEDAPK